MGITNQQIAERIDKAIEAMERIVIEMVQSNRELYTKNEQEHKEFRESITDQKELLALVRQEQERHGRNWQALWKIAVVPILVGIVGAILALILK